MAADMAEGRGAPAQSPRTHQEEAMAHAVEAKDSECMKRPSTTVEHGWSTELHHSDVELDVIRGSSASEISKRHAEEYAAFCETGRRARRSARNWSRRGE